MVDNAHALDPEEVARQLDADLTAGLSAADVEPRRAQYGANVLPRAKQRRLVRILLDQLLNLIVLLLVIAAAISWLTGEHVEAIAILVVVVLNAAVGFTTEWQSGRALEALRKQTRVMTTVRREGRSFEVLAQDLVVGDLVLLSAGDRVPADLRVLEATGVLADESTLTGESRSVSKSVEPVAADTVLAERSSMLYLGTVVTAGHATGIVVATGQATELGRIGKLVGEIEEEPTLLQSRLAQLGRRLVYIVLVIAAIVSVTGWARGEPLWQMVEVGISLAVAAVPEALPAVTTFILAFGVLRMARRQAIVRRLSAVETLGSCTVICSDKTGTLTLNEMTVVELRLPDGSSIEGPYDSAPAREALTIGALCNDATSTSGDPTEIALIAAAEGAGLDVESIRQEHPRVREHPFDSATKRMITIHEQDGEFLYALKGAPHVVLKACDLAKQERELLLESNREMAGRGHRVLGLAQKRAASPDDDPDRGFTFVGFVGMADPPRPGVLEAIRSARTAGIRVIMLTGDQIETARAIARELQLAGREPRARHARDLDGASHQELSRIVTTTDVFARVTPEEKYRIVEALQNGSEVVAVTGDGVNDAPALKKADVGVAMGKRGTEVAKEAADIVLADDNFTTIVGAIEGGRTIYANIIKFVHLMFSHNLSEVLTIFVALLIGWPLPLLPLQILWLNLVTDVFPAFALALEPAAPDTMRRPPRSRRESLLGAPLLVLIGWQGMILTAITLIEYGWALRAYGPGAHARTVALLALVGCQIGHTFNCRSRVHSAFSGIFRNPHLWFATFTVLGLQAIAVGVKPLRDVLRVVPPNAADAVALAVAVVLPVAIVETQKFFHRRIVSSRA